MWNLDTNLGKRICVIVNETNITAAIIQYVSVAAAQLTTNLLMEPKKCARLSSNWKSVCIFL